MNITEIIISPLISEKTHIMKMSKIPKLSFIVNMKANKIEIKKAFLAMFGIKPLKVNSIIRKPQPTRMILRSRKNYSKAFKIAHISITQDDFLKIKQSMEEGSQE